MAGHGQHLQVPRKEFSDDDCIDSRHNAEDTETTSLLFSEAPDQFLEARRPEDGGDYPHLSRKKAPPVLHERTMFLCGLDGMLLIIIFLCQSSSLVELFSAVMFHHLLNVHCL